MTKKPISASSTPQTATADNGVTVTVRNLREEQRMNRLLDGDHFTDQVAAESRRQELYAQGRRVAFRRIQVDDGVLFVVKDQGEHPRRRPVEDREEDKRAEMNAAAHEALRRRLQLSPADFKQFLADRQKG
jgi:hypothetical protein